MRPYNVEIFNQDGSFVFHQNVGRVAHTYDYLAPSSNEITLRVDNRCEDGQYIRIVGNGYDWFGRITGVSKGGSTSKSLMTVSYESFINAFDVDILFDTDYQGSGISLEQVIANYINALFVNNADQLQNIPNLTVTTTTSTTRWGLHITSDVAGNHLAIVNFRDSVIIRAMEKYKIYIDVKPDFATNRINLYIGANTAEVKTIEADLPNVIEKNVVIKQTLNNLNKLTVYNEENYDQSITYYLHPDDDYDTSDTDRVTPVHFDTESTIAVEGQTFEAAAQLVATDRFSGRAYNNLIELKIMNDDSLIDPQSMELGQEVQVITNGVEYDSYLTGISVGTLTTLTFGAVRIDLTKIIRGATNGN